MLKVLAIDGGGIRGVIPAAVLKEIEQRTGKRIAELFDLIAGTSTGGILALGLAKPSDDDPSAPEFSAADLSALYEQEGGHIFERSVAHRIAALDNLLDEKYSAKGLEGVLDRYFGDVELKDAVTEVLVTSYELEKRDPWFFARHKARKDPSDNFPMRFVARATSAAPTYFEPEELPASYPHGGLIDGGVFANNPAMCAFVETKKLQVDTKACREAGKEPPADGRFDPSIEEILLVSLGTGQHTRPIHYDDAKGWGLARWAKPILDVVFDGVSDTVDHQMSVLCQRSAQEDPRYFRFQQELNIARDAMDDVSSKNIAKLQEEAKQLIDRKQGDLDTLCRLLTVAAAAPV